MNNEVCAICGMSADAEFFDNSSIVDFPEKGDQAVLATFQLPPQYCGVLETFAQITIFCNRYNEQINTPGLEWMILRNGQPLYPYTLKFEFIINPWGYNNYPVRIRLDEHAKIEFIARNRAYDPTKDGEIQKVGGRISGHYWYNRAYGGDGKAAGCEIFVPIEEGLSHMPGW